MLYEDSSSPVRLQFTSLTSLSSLSLSPPPPLSFLCFSSCHSLEREKSVPPPPLLFLCICLFVCFVVVVGWLLFLAQRQEEEYWYKKNHWNSTDYLCNLTAASNFVTTYLPPGQSPRSFQVIKSQVTVGVTACVIGHFTWEQTWKKWRLSGKGRRCQGRLGGGGRSV